MQVGTHPGIDGKLFHKILFQVGGVQRGKTQAFLAHVLGYCCDNVGQRDFLILLCVTLCDLMGQVSSVGTKIDAGKDQFLISGCQIFLCLGDDMFRRQGPTWPPQGRNGAKGTSIIAPILHLEKCSAAFGKVFNQREFPCCSPVGNRADADGSLVLWGGFPGPLCCLGGGGWGWHAFDVCPQVFFFGIAQDQGDPWHCAKAFGMALCVAPCDHQLSLGVFTYNATDPLSCLPVTFGGDRAGVDDDQMGLGLGVYGVKSMGEATLT